MKRFLAVFLLVSGVAAAGEIYSVRVQGPGGFDLPLTVTVEHVGSTGTGHDNETPTPEPPPVEPPPVTPHVGPVGFRATNVGLCIERGPKHLAQIFAPIPLGVDHEQANVPHIRLWYDGGFALDQQKGYMPSAACHNTALLAGLSPRQLERIERVSAEATPYGCKVVTSIGGRHTNWIGSFHRPVAYCDDWTRTVEFHRPNRFVVSDSFKGRKPPTLEAYYPFDRVEMEKAPLWQVIYHSPVEPTAIEGGYEWKTSLGQTVRVTATSPRGPPKSIVLKTVNGEHGISGYFNGPLTGHQVRFLSDAPTAEIRTTVEVTQ